MSWYRTYRPRRVAELHLTSVRTALLEYLQQGWLPHSLLLVGPKGTGKTSTARIIAAILNDPANAAVVAELFKTASAKVAPTKKAAAKTTTPLQEPNTDDPVVQRIIAGSSLAIHELDAASHRGIDDVRQLKEQVALPPAEGQVAVFILDEVHMLTTEAFNALLKLLEEPPAKVVFILATTEPHKLPATIVSRCTVVQFQPATTAELVAAVQQIAEKEQVVFDQAGLELLAAKADGSFRDAVKWAEQVAGQVGGLTAAQVAPVLGQVNNSAQALVQAILAKDPVAVVTACQQLRGSQPEYRAALRAVIDYLYSQMLIGIGVTPGEPALPTKVSHYLLQALAALPATETSPVPLLTLELKALEIVFKAQKTDKPPSPPPPRTNGQKNTAEPAASSTTGLQAAKPAAAESAERSSDTLASDIPTALSFTSAQPEVVPPAVPLAIDPQLVIEQWPAVVAAVKTRNGSLAAILNSALPGIDAQGRPQLTLYYRFHAEQLQQPKFQAMLQAGCKEALGTEVELQYLVASPTAPAATDNTTPADTVPASDLSAAANQILL